MQPVLGRRPQRVDVAGGERGDEQRGAADVEHRVVERDLSGRSRRALTVGVSRSGIHTTTSGTCAERDAHDVPGRHRDDAAVQRRGRVVGVALELGSRRAAPRARAARALPPRCAIAASRPATRDSARVAEPAAAREATPSTASGPSPPACRNARTAGCVSDAGSPRSLTST